MFYLKSSAPDFALAALRAGESAGFLAAMMLLARHLDSKAEHELRVMWGDLDDLTHSDVLVLVTGLAMDPARGNYVQNGPSIFADGIGIRGANRYNPDCDQLSFAATCVDLLEVASPQPDEPKEGDERLLSPQGLTDIRRVLHLREELLPCILILDYRSKTEYVVQLGEGSQALSAPRFIREFVAGLNDLPFQSRKARKERGDLKAILPEDAKRVKTAERAWRTRQRRIDGRAIQVELVAKRIQDVLSHISEAARPIGEKLITSLRDELVAAHALEEMLNQFAVYANARVIKSASKNESNLVGHVRSLIRSRRRFPANPLAANSARIEYEQMLNKHEQLKHHLQQLEATMARLDGRLTFIVEEAVQTAINKFGTNRRAQSDVNELPVIGLTRSVFLFSDEIAALPVRGASSDRTFSLAKGKMTNSRFNPHRLTQLEEILDIEYEKYHEFEKEILLSDGASKITLKQRFKRDVIPQLRAYEQEYAETLVAGVPTSQIPETEATEIVDDLSQATDTLLQKVNATAPQEMLRRLAELRTMLSEKKESASAKLKVSLPLIPTICSYEIEVETAGLLRNVWNRARVFLKGLINQFPR